MTPIRTTSPLVAVLLGVTGLAAVTSCGAPAPRERVVQSSSALSAPTTGHWIWATTDTANQWVAFRKTLSLSAAPSSAVAQIAADTKYWLYVNGTLVTFEGGLKRGPNPSDTYYDEKDIKSYLKAGSNTIAILVWHFGKSGTSHKDSGAAGLLFQSDIVVGTITTRVNSDTTWKAKQHPGYGENLNGSQPNDRLAESNIYYDARNAASMTNWNQVAFVDTTWARAVDKGVAGGAPWNGLVLRPIPFFKYSALTSYLNPAPAWGQDATPIVMNLPGNLQVTPYLQVSAAAGAVIGIQTDHYMDGGEANVRSTFITTGGTQTFESLGWMSGVNVQYTIPSSVQILALKYRESGYDTTIAGSFTSSDSFFNTLWKKASATMYLNMRDNYSDCPTRERAQWWGDAVNEQKQGFYVFDPNVYRLGSKAINELVSWQKPDGHLFSPIPGNYYNELPVQMLASVYSFRTFGLYTGDLPTIEATYNRVKTYMNTWSLDADGLVVHRPSADGIWDWEDWGDNVDARLLDNAWFSLALGTTMQLATLTGNNADLAAWQQKSNSISSNFDRVLWDEAHQAYRSPDFPAGSDTDDRGNALAVVADLAPSSRRAALRQVLRSHTNASPYMELYALEAMYLLGDPAGAEARIKARYTDQVNDPGYTLWEYWTKGGIGTDNHGWNGGPLYTLSAYATGVRPTGTGYSSYRVTPQLGSQTSINTVVPTSKGSINVSVSTTSPTNLSLSVTATPSTLATIGVPRIGMFNPTIRVNGSTIYSGETPVSGVPGVGYAGRDADYVYFQASPNSFAFTETGSSGTFCATEGGTCSFSGIQQVRYGAGTSFFYKVANGDYGSIPCTSAAFGGDPVFGVVKQCYIAAPIPDTAPPGYTSCSSEGGTCQFSGTANVIFGAYGSYTSGIYTNGVACNTGVLGDPIFGAPKRCYYSLQPSGNGWTSCAGEADTCSFVGTRRVAYGANSAFLYKTDTDHTPCNNASFGGDPIPGTVKSCYYK